MKWLFTFLVHNNSSINGSDLKILSGRYVYEGKTCVLHYPSHCDGTVVWSHEISNVLYYREEEISLNGVPDRVSL